METKKPIFIAEIKTKSMFGFESKYSRNTLIDTAIEFGSWISIHTDPRFGGSFDDIYQIRKETNKPILAKGFHSHDDDVKKSLDLGADHVLVVDRIPENNITRCLLEFHSLSMVEKCLYESPGCNDIFKFVYNGRDLRNGKMKDGNEYAKYRSNCQWLCGASFIEDLNDLYSMYPECDAFIVGEYLPEFVKYL